MLIWIRKYLEIIHTNIAPSPKHYFPPPHTHTQIQTHPTYTTIQKIGHKTQSPEGYLIGTFCSKSA